MPRLNGVQAIARIRSQLSEVQVAVAEAAGVALDTVYAAVGPKPVLFRLLVPERRPAQHLPITRGQ
jgi:hypothetical protein